jgi:hypothetical protein
MHSSTHRGKSGRTLIKVRSMGYVYEAESVQLKGCWVVALNARLVVHGSPSGYEPLDRIWPSREVLWVRSAR